MKSISIAKSTWKEKTKTITNHFCADTSPRKLNNLPEFFFILKKPLIPKARAHKASKAITATGKTCPSHVTSRISRYNNGHSQINNGGKGAYGFHALPENVTAGSTRFFRTSFQFSDLQYGAPARLAGAFTAVISTLSIPLSPARPTSRLFQPKPHDDANTLPCLDLTIACQPCVCLYYKQDCFLTHQSKPCILNRLKKSTFLPILNNMGVVSEYELGLG